MENKMMRILSFIMVAMFAFTLLGLSIGAEEVDIPVIEEVTEEELGETIPDEEEVLAEVEVLAVEEADAEAALYDGETFSAYYASFEDAVAAVKSGSFENTPEIRLLKDVELGPDESKASLQINTGKKFIVNGQTHVVRDLTLDKSAGNSAVGNAGSIQLVGANTYLVAKNVRFTRDYKKAYAFFHLSGGSLELSDNAIIGGTADDYLIGGNGAALFVEAGTSGFYMTSDTAAVQYCKNGGHGCIGLYVTAPVSFAKGSINNIDSTNPAVHIRGKNRNITFEEGFVIENCDVAIATSYGNFDGSTDLVVSTATVTFNGQNIKDCGTAILVSGGTEMTLKGNVTITGNTMGIDVQPAGKYASQQRAKGKLILDGNINVYGNTNDIYQYQADCVEVTSNYSGKSGSAWSDGGNEVVFGHLAENTESFPGTIYRSKYDGTNENRFKAVPYLSLIGPGKVTLDGKEYALKNPEFEKDLPDNALVFNYPMYVKTGSDASGYVRLGGTCFGEGDTPAGEVRVSYPLGSSLYLLSDVETTEEVLLNSSNHINLNGNGTRFLYGNGHTMTKLDPGAFTFVHYSGVNMTYRDLIFNGNNKGCIAYIHCTGGKGATINFENSIAYNGKAGTSSLFHTNIGNASTGDQSTATGTINITNSKVVNGTGAAIVTGYRTTVTVTDSDFVKVGSTTGTGGVFYINGSTSSLIFKGNNTITGATAAKGAAISTSGTTTVDGTLTIDGCSATSGSGAIDNPGKVIVNGNLIIKNCSASAIGAAMNIGSEAQLNVSAGGKLSIENCSTTSEGGGGAIYTNGTIINAGTLIVDGCSAKGNGAGININMGTVTSTGTLSVTNCSDTNTNGSGGGVYYHSAAAMNLSGKVVITGNTVNAKENNLGMPANHTFTITGNLSNDSSVGISTANSGATIAKVSSTDITGIDKIFADGAEARYYTAPGEYTKRSITATLFPNTVGDGKIAEDGDAVIDMSWKADRIEGREKDVVLHWPWIVEAADGTVRGCVSFVVAYDSLPATSTVYAQKDMTIEHLWGKGIDANTTNRNDVFNHVEFPLYGSNNNLNHINIGTYFNVNGNGHAFDMDKASDGNYIFIVGWGRHLYLENFIFEGYKPVINIHSGVANGTDTVDVINSYIDSVSHPAITSSNNVNANIYETTIKGSINIEKGGIVTLTDSEIIRAGVNINMSGAAAVADDPATEDKDETAPLKISYLYLKGDTYISSGDGIYVKADGYSEIVIDKSYTGEVLLNYANSAITKVKPGDGFTALETVKSITQAGTNGATFAYYDAETEKFAWASVPELELVTDAGQYSLGDTKPGVIRFKTTFKSLTGGSISSCGIYALGKGSFNNEISESVGAIGKIENVAPAIGNKFYVDALIPEDNVGDSVYATHFVYFKGIKNPWFNALGNFTIEGAADTKVKDLGTYVPKAA